MYRHTELRYMFVYFLVMLCIITNKFKQICIYYQEPNTDLSFNIYSEQKSRPYSYFRFDSEIIPFL